MVIENSAFLDIGGYDFLLEYANAVGKLFIENDIVSPSLTDEKRNRQLDEFENTKKKFEALLDEKMHNELVAAGSRRFSYRSSLAALFINLYRDEPILHLPYRFLTYLIDIDENFTTWRYKHALDGAKDDRFKGWNRWFFRASLSYANCGEA